MLVEIALPGTVAEIAHDRFQRSLCLSMAQVDDVATVAKIGKQRRIGIGRWGTRRLPGGARRQQT